jgi:hypothetical protein
MIAKTGNIGKKTALRIKLLMSLIMASPYPLFALQRFSAREIISALFV